MENRLVLLLASSFQLLNVLSFLGIFLLVFFFLFFFFGSFKVKCFESRKIPPS